MNSLNETLLDSKLAELEKARSWSPRVVSKLEQLIRGGDDWALFKVNPLAFAAEKGLAEAEAVDLFLHAAKQQLFAMNWQLLCPMCGDTVGSFATLKGMHSTLVCSLCHLETLAQLDDYIQITFTLSPQVRTLAGHQPESLSPEDFYFRYRFSPYGVNKATGMRFVDLLRERFLKAVLYLEPGESRTLELDLTPGFLLGHDLLNESGFFLKVDSQAPREVELAFDGAYSPREGVLGSGRATARLENKSGKRASLMLLNLPPEYPQMAAPLQFAPYLSGKRLLTTQTFRDLFQFETIAATAGIGVKDITLVFTDLKGSTALYDRIGDLKAFTLVQQHFERLGRVVREHSGSIVKTIGDAVMASFMSPVDAVQASLKMLRVIEQFNQEQGSRELILKIGLHKGPSILVTLNERLDYFGQTVNVAARVQSLAEADEICLTDDVLEFPGVRPVLGEFGRPEDVQLRGVSRGVRLYRLHGGTTSPATRR